MDNLISESYFKLNVCCNEQLVALAQAGYGINSDILKAESKFTYVMSFMLAICLYRSLPYQMLTHFLSHSLCHCKAELTDICMCVEESSSASLLRFYFSSPLNPNFMQY